MSDKQKLAVVHTWGPHFLDRPGLPSQLLREEEARLIAELARKAHLKGYRFQGWPDIRITERVPGDMWARTLCEIRAEVTAVPL